VGEGALPLAYTDLLLHDMGEAGADGIAQAAAGPREFRTPPLWGLRHSSPPYLHDARATSLLQAIALHGGEAQRSADAFERLPAAERDALIAFLRGL
jgi:CxxC motif-containing protein (DUF1111 family)